MASFCCFVWQFAFMARYWLRSPQLQCWSSGEEMGYHNRYISLQQHHIKLASSLLTSCCRPVVPQGLRRGNIKLLLLISRRWSAIRGFQVAIGPVDTEACFVTPVVRPASEQVSINRFGRMSAER
ncbi:hypothetical protein GE09DRAFT_109629 [Coniochaeta sp. 2T2.1]|nr:hypothetical protein GE09DRAFT_109629 [Coniochaeta sp. 2T2.1]